MINQNEYSREDINMLLKTNRERFEKYCEKAYAAIVDCKTTDFDKLENPEIARSAMLRMLGFFEEIEEFEKCNRIREILKYRFPDMDTEPKYDYTKI
jgi:hypothetical protein